MLIFLVDSSDYLAPDFFRIAIPNSSSATSIMVSAKVAVLYAACFVQEVVDNGLGALRASCRHTVHRSSRNLLPAKGDVAKFDFCRISTSPFSYNLF